MENDEGGSQAKTQEKREEARAGDVGPGILQAEELQLRRGFSLVSVALSLISAGAHEQMEKLALWRCRVLPKALGGVLV